MRVYDGENLKDTDPQGQELPGVPRLRRRRRRHDRRLDALRLQDPVQGLQLRLDRDRRQPGAPDVRAGAADRARAVPARDRAEVPRLTSRSTWRRATPSSSARKSRRPTSSPTPSTARTSSTATSTYADFWIQDQEFRDTDTGEIFDRAALNAELEKIEKPAGHRPTRRTSATRSSTSCCARAPATPARTRPGPATRSCAR